MIVSKVFEDGSVWMVMDKKEAKALFWCGAKLYRIDGDKTKGPVGNLERLYTHEGLFGIKVGTLPVLLDEYIKVNGWDMEDLFDENR